MNMRGVEKCSREMYVDPVGLLMIPALITGWDNMILCSHLVCFLSPSGALSLK